jgi:hypothetical protein
MADLVSFVKVLDEAVVVGGAKHFLTDDRVCSACKAAGRRQKSVASTTSISQASITLKNAIPQVHREREGAGGTRVWGLAPNTVPVDPLNADMVDDRRGRSR